MTGPGVVPGSVAGATVGALTNPAGSGVTEFRGSGAVGDGLYLDNGTGVGKTGTLGAGGLFTGGGP
ncbi:MAG: hypothetical protein NVSMB62_27900 [Acidobacteriaceae bacterium]